MSLAKLGFYSDCPGNAHWSGPDKIIDRCLAQKMVKLAELFAEKEAVTPKEIELWIAHLGPAYGAPMETIKIALLNWYRAMREAGLFNEDDTVVKEFVSGLSPMPPERQSDQPE